MNENVTATSAETDPAVSRRRTLALGLAAVAAGAVALVPDTARAAARSDQRRSDRPECAADLGVG